jgi:hypothetical protein
MVSAPIRLETPYSLSRRWETGPVAWPVALLPLLMTVVFTCGGCNTLPAGSAQRLADAHPPHVILLRGWRGLYSAGIDELAQKLRAQGLTCEVYRHDQWRDVARATRCEPVIVGFSYGADDAIQLARSLDARGIAVPLLVTIDPVTPPIVPANVQWCANFYQSNSVTDVFPWLRGVPLRGANVTNYDLRKDRRDLLEPRTGHATIAANPKLHDEIVGRVVALRGRAATVPAARE